ncbi:MAG: trimethylamine methyltransferase family protein [Gammaproteobacteria bacterium]|nr:trimethylamine methyltransferase family protein [Gammaproteobacteria bacterium]
MSRTKGSRRSRNRNNARIGLNNITQPPFKQFSHPYSPVEVLSADQIESIHNTSLTILEEIGMKVLEPEARNIFADAGCSVNHQSEMVYLDRALVTEQIAHAPAEFTLHARNAVHTIKVGGKNVIFTSVGGPAFVSCLDKGRRNGSYEEMCDFIKLTQMLNIIHLEGGGPFEALDLPHLSRHLDLHIAQITLTDKIWQLTAFGNEVTLDGINMASMAMGLTPDDIVNKPIVATVINTNSPLQLDIPMAQGLITMAKYGQPSIITPFTLAGAMSPVTLAGTLAQQNAEVLGTITLAQLVRSGTPVIYGGFTSNVDMKTGSPAFGTPEYTLAAQASGQLARRYNIPFRSSNVTSSNTVDAQAAYESQMSVWGAMNGHVNILNHGAGWLGGGLVASFEKLILDAEMLQMFAAYSQPIEVNEETLALDAIKDVGPGGHFFGTSHTMDRYQTAFYKPLLSDWDNYENWTDKGSEDSAIRANKIWKKMLADYEKPALDVAIVEQLNDYVRQRKSGLSAI